MKTLKIIAIMLISAGLIIGLIILSIIKFDLKIFANNTTITNEYSIEETFSNIKITAAESDIEFILSTDENSKIICQESEEITHDIKVENNTLTITRKDNRKWYQRIGIYWNNFNTKIYLPKDTYENLEITSASGDIKVNESFKLTNATINNVSGETYFRASVSQNLSIYSTSGDILIANTNPNALTVKAVSGNITIENIEVANDVNLEIVSGDIEIHNMKAKNFITNVVTGSTELTNVIIDAKMNLETTTGDVNLDLCDANDIKIETTTGNIKGSLLSDKTFTTNTTTGKIKVPNTEGNPCILKTTTGDIDIIIK